MFLKPHANNQVQKEKNKGEPARMTVKEIAELANVSVSTVSKVINKKDDSISADTRERVLEIVKQYHFTPYRPSEEQRPSLVLGILIGQSADYGLLTGVVKQARARGYSTIVCPSSTAEEETQNFETLASHHVDGIIWAKEPYSIPAPPDGIASATVVHTLDSREKPSDVNAWFSYAELGYAAARALTDKGHTRIGCICSDDGAAGQSFTEGIRRFLFDRSIPFDEPSDRRSAADSDFLWVQTHTGVICFDTASVSRLAALADSMNLHVPDELSVIGVDTGEMRIAGVRVSSLSSPFEELGRFAADRLIDRVETGRSVYAEFSRRCAVTCEDSIVPPKKADQGRFVVVGTINVDTLMTVDKQPEPGETVTVRNRLLMPGGKGLNQAVGISKLGGAASLISFLGSDYDGRRVFECLRGSTVCTDGVMTHDSIPTGHAYIFIQSNAESNISVFDGANDALTAADIDRFEYLFENTDYCLIQTELDQQVVLRAAELAHRHGAKVILKPCTVTSLLPELLRSADILVPNEKEAETLVPAAATVEDRAAYFLQNGAGSVIITLAERGCLFADGNQTKRFPAARVTPVDTTGAADAFIAAFAYYLAQGKSAEEAISYANCAAGLSTMRHGVPPALIERETLELYYSEHQAEFGEIKNENSCTGGPEY